MWPFRSHESPVPMPPPSAGPIGILVEKVHDEIRRSVRRELDRALILAGVGVLAVIVAATVFVAATWALLDEFGRPL